MADSNTKKSTNPNSRRKRIPTKPLPTTAPALAEVLPRFSRGLILWAGPTHATSVAGLLQQNLSEAGVDATRAETGQALDLGEGARLEVLAGRNLLRADRNGWVDVQSSVIAP